MKKFFYPILVIFLFSIQNISAQQADPNNGLRHIMTAEEAANSDKIGLGFVETPPPTGVIRNVEEFGNNDGALIRYPFGIPIALIKEMAKDAKVTTIVANNTEKTTVTNLYQTNGINLANCSFLIAPSNSYWTRDYGPWYVTYGNDEIGIVDFPYNRPRPSDDEIPKKVAASQGITWFGMNVIHTGGNYMTNGIDEASSTTLVWVENPSQSHAQINQKMKDYLGINEYIVAEDPNGTYIDHIDCWSKFLAPNKILIRKVPASHPQYSQIEATANYYASLVSSYGTPYKIYRVNTPNNEPYTNSFILKNKVFVPIMGNANDAAALQVYQQAMPGYQVIGLLGNPGTPWESTDALHCRTHEMADLGMLMISHIPLSDTIPARACFKVDANITAFSKQLIYPDSVWTIYKVNSGNWDTITMTHSGTNRWSACIPGQMEGSVISYYIHAEDASNRSSNHPYIGAPDPHQFVIQTSQVAGIVVSPDTLFFNTAEDVLNGKTAVIANYTQQAVEVTAVDQAGQNPFSWVVVSNAVNFPLWMQPADSLSLDVKPQLPLPISASMLCDTLHITKGTETYKVMLCLDPVLLTNNEIFAEAVDVKVFPNPTSSSITFNLNIQTEDEVSIEIFSSKGELVAAFNNKKSGIGNNSIFWNGRSMNNEDLPSGLYLYRISAGSKSKTGKISILH